MYSQNFSVAGGAVSMLCPVWEVENKPGCSSLPI